LAGFGGEKGSARWHTAAPGKRIVYLAEHPAASLLETLVNLKGNPQFFPESFRLLKVKAAENVSMLMLAPELLSENWRDNKDETRSLGDRWLNERHSALLAVPSAPSPESTNYLLNPLHQEAEGVAIEWYKRIKYDKRLFHFSTEPGMK
jgi:RES domain-containing protein